MRRTYLVAYDISDPKRLRRVHRAMRGFGEALQYSVFLCPLSAAELVVLREKIGVLIHERDDSILIAGLGPEDGRVSRSISWMGRRPGTLGLTERIAVIV